MFVVAVLALVVAVTVPPSNGRSGRMLERAGGEVADALVFARGEALRTSIPYGVRVQGGRRVAVFRLDRTVGPPPVERYDVYHPVDKSLYDVDLYSNSFTAGTSATGYFLFQRAGAADVVVSFDANGEPMRGNDGVPLATGGVLLANESSTLAVTLTALTGRVSVGRPTGAVATPANAFPAALQP